MIRVMKTWINRRISWHRITNLIPCLRITRNLIKTLFIPNHMRSLLIGAILSASLCWAQTSNKLLLFTAGYRLPVTKPMIINSGRGLYVEAGINPLWFASQKVSFGFFGGYALRDNFWNTSFNDQFSS